MKKKILVTGGLGFIGSKLCEKLIYENYKIIIIDNFYSNIKKKLKNCKIIKADITNFNSLKNIREKNIDILIHLAAQSSGPKSFLIPDEDVKINVLGTINLIKLCKLRNIKKFIFTSSFTVYGNKNKAKPKEIDHCSPSSFYAISKFASEKYIQLLCAKYKIDWTVLRLFNVYGPGQNMSRMDQGIVSIYLRLVKENKIIKITGKKNRYRDLVFIDDVVQAIKLCILRKRYSKNQIYNVGTGEKIFIYRIIFEIAKLYKKKITIEVAGNTPGDIHGAYANIDKLKKIGYRPKFNFKKGIRIFKEWYDQQSQEI